MATRIAVQQQQRLFREGLEQLLQLEDDFELCGSAAGPGELLEMCAEAHPEVVLLEAETSRWDVDRLCTSLRSAHPGLRLIGLSAGPTTPSDVTRARRSGMSALVPRAMGIAGILGALRAAVAKPQRSSLAVVRSSASGGAARNVLTPRELKVLHLVGAGYTSREISGRLDISHKTVENHKQRIFGKL
ncbi:MAG: response regulator transcription factor, partial [Actinobacteria bacterium]|nr:response regulator transcription factor [Actinomycetota bacterium]